MSEGAPSAALTTSSRFDSISYFEDQYLQRAVLRPSYLVASIQIISLVGIQDDLSDGMSALSQGPEDCFPLIGHVVCLDERVGE